MLKGVVHFKTQNLVFTLLLSLRSYIGCQ